MVLSCLSTSDSILSWRHWFDIGIWMGLSNYSKLGADQSTRIPGKHRSKQYPVSVCVCVCDPPNILLCVYYNVPAYARVSLDVNHRKLLPPDVIMWLANTPWKTTWTLHKARVSPSWAWLYGSVASKTVFQGLLTRVVTCQLYTIPAYGRECIFSRRLGFIFNVPLSYMWNREVDTDNIRTPLVHNPRQPFGKICSYLGAWTPLAPGSGLLDHTWELGITLFRCRVSHAE